MNIIQKYLILASCFFASQVVVGNDKLHSAHAKVLKHWTADRMANAMPRDLAIDQRGFAYLRKPNGLLAPYGHQVAAQAQEPKAKPSGSDSTPPTIVALSPLAGQEIGESHTFQADVSDESGVKSVSFSVRKGSGVWQAFTPTRSGDTWSVTLSPFTKGSWSWRITAKDNGSKGGNTTSSAVINFTVKLDGITTPVDPSADSDIITNKSWSFGGDVQSAAGRIYFEMPNNHRRKRWSAYVCSGTVINDGGAEKSVIITAAHCVYDDVNKAFARRVLFIPNQSASGTSTDTDCSNDQLGCWMPSYGVVDKNWTTRTFPDNIQWDYAYYIVNDSGAHSGQGSVGQLESAVQELSIDFSTPPIVDEPTSDADRSYALGYSYSDDPNFMYCAEDMTRQGAINWWLPNCGLSGGASGGPWVQPMSEGTGAGPIVSVNSWGFTGSPGMAGPLLDQNNSSALCVYLGAIPADMSSISAAEGDEGVVVTCP